MKGRVICGGVLIESLKAQIRVPEAKQDYSLKYQMTAWVRTPEKQQYDDLPRRHDLDSSHRSMLTSQQPAYMMHPSFLELAKKVCDVQSPGKSSDD